MRMSLALLVAVIGNSYYASCGDLTEEVELVQENGAGQTGNGIKEEEHGLAEEYEDVFSFDGEGTYDTTTTEETSQTQSPPGIIVQYLGFELPCARGYEKDNLGVCRKVMEFMTEGRGGVPWEVVVRGSSGGGVCRPSYFTLLALVIISATKINVMMSGRSGRH